MFNAAYSVGQTTKGNPACTQNSPNRTTRGQLLLHKGEQTRSGQKALDYVRIRHGIGDGSDIGRIKRQQAFMANRIKKMKDDVLTPTSFRPSLMPPPNR
ncbi:LCP family protein [Streptomyces mirabilis]|nr:LCP family protein [Streptomyces mirabilis]